MLRDEEKFSLPKLEERILKFWKENRIFEKSINPKRARGKKTFVFFEGPPTANGRPGIHHVLARAFKDVIPRYKTMRGYNVPRKGGWDTHGLPVEIEVEKTLGLKSKREIEAYGVANFNKKCKESVWKYKDEWEKLTDRIGFWLDLKNPYITYETSYIETLWWVIAQIAKRKLLYKGHKVVPWCTRCGTGLSSHELALGYKEVEDTSVYVKFKLDPQDAKRLTSGDKPVYILSWTTTPWTLPGNVALAINKTTKYSMVLIEGEILVVANELITKIFGDTNEISLYGRQLKGEDLVNLKYKPLFDVTSLKSNKSYKVYPADFVTTTDGTGVVHTAVMYGEDDYNLGKKIGLPQYHTVDDRGFFTKDVSGLSGLYVKSREAEEKIFNHLKSHKLLFKTDTYKHEYPFCWRCGTALLYYARHSWFVEMSKLRTRLIASNKKINWIPENLKTGRFGGWLKEAKDWAFSRERYWGTPLPIWECNECDNIEVVDGRESLSSRLGESRNKYILMRHGRSENNKLNLVNNSPMGLNKYSLTLEGRAKTEAAAQKLKKEKVDLIISSDFKRTRETAEIVRKVIGKNIHLTIDSRIREIDTGVYEGGEAKKYWNFFNSIAERFTKTPPEGESLRDVAKRAFDLVSELEDKYEGKTILLVTHEYTIWALETAMRGWSEEESSRAKSERDEFINNSEWREVPLKFLPKNENNITDLHKPYIDSVNFSCSKCKEGKMSRVKEVADVWFDSGAMPFAQAHFPFEEKKSTLSYPADYICEAIDQTRGWFYTLLAVGTLLGKPAPYKNVISLGHILDKNGQKMSKSKGNIVDPWIVIEKYGADVVRWYFYTAGPPGEPRRFNELELQKTSRQFFAILYNSFVFYDTYAKKNLKPKTKNSSQQKNILDKWILAKLNDLIQKVSKNLDKYEIGEAAREIENFAVEDLSRWFIRRSRRRFQLAHRGSDKGEKSDFSAQAKRDYEDASQTLGLVLTTLSKLSAPFVPFFAEGLHRSLVSKNAASVHLEDWPDGKKLDAKSKRLVEGMKELRKLAGVALAKRAEIGIKVRQPLNELRIKSDKLNGHRDLLDILCDEVNVKRVVFDKKSKDEVVLDTEITPELRAEGVVRDFVRMIQDLRQDGGLKPKDRIILIMECSAETMGIIQKNEKILMKEVNAKNIEYKKSDKFDAETQTKFEEKSLWLGLRKIKQ